MGKVTTVTCDCCNKEISAMDYQTISIRKYRGKKHENKIALPAFWLCDKCFRKLMTVMCLEEKEVEE